MGCCCGWSHWDCGGGGSDRDGGLGRQQPAARAVVSISPKIPRSIRPLLWPADGIRSGISMRVHQAARLRAVHRKKKSVLFKKRSVSRYQLHRH